MAGDKSWFYFSIDDEDEWVPEGGETPARRNNDQRCNVHDGNLFVATRGRIPTLAISALKCSL
jgi:hypothetical protein